MKKCPERVGFKSRLRLPKLERGDLCKRVETRQALDMATGNPGAQGGTSVSGGARGQNPSDVDAAPAFVDKAIGI